MDDERFAALAPGYSPNCGQRAPPSRSIAAVAEAQFALGLPGVAREAVPSQARSVE
jgi:hypothetical protein